MDEEQAALDLALHGRDAPAAARAAHRLTGRLAFIREESFCEYTRTIEAAVAAKNWAKADSVRTRLGTDLPALRSSLMRQAAGPA